jgi:hypothetical protein
MISACVCDECGVCSMYVSCVCGVWHVWGMCPVYVFLCVM